MSAPLPVPYADLKAFTRDFIKAVLRNVARHGDDADLKACIMIAREHGHLTDEETGLLINAWGVRNA